ncbi:hypothetical protein ECTHUN299_55420 [Escherichia coli]|nr:hypothetical protein ECTHUN299_55420 [Escherichia coli]
MDYVSGAFTVSVSIPLILGQARTSDDITRKYIHYAKQNICLFINVAIAHAAYHLMMSLRYGDNDTLKTDGLMPY